MPARPRPRTRPLRPVESYFVEIHVKYILNAFTYINKLIYRFILRLKVRFSIVCFYFIYLNSLMYFYNSICSNLKCVKNAFILIYSMTSRKDKENTLQEWGTNPLPPCLQSL